MLSIRELESACAAAEPVELPRHVMDPPELSLQETFYPFGFPVEIRTNSDCVLKQYKEMWGRFEKQHDTEPIRSEVQLVEVSSTECPPEPTHRFMDPLMMAVADRDNYSIVDLEHCTVKTTISSAALRHSLYAQYFLLGTPGCCVASRYTTPVHAGCVALNGRGVLLCGDSGAGKSTLSFACARAGWTYVTDDASFLLNGGTERVVTGNCHQVRFRPSAAALFPEIQGLEITPRAAGKPSIELQIAPMSHIVRASTMRVDFIVFLNRDAGGALQLAPYRKDVARQSMRQLLYGPSKWLTTQYKALDQLLAVEVFELRYNDLDEAIGRLQKLVQEGQ